MSSTDKHFKDILKTEYSKEFDEHRKKAMVNSYYKYGPCKDNYGKYKCLDARGNIRKRLEKYEETGNTEFLVDLANYAMLEFMYPSIDGAHFTPTHTGVCESVGVSINEIRREAEGLK